MLSSGRLRYHTHSVENMESGSTEIARRGFHTSGSIELKPWPEAVGAVDELRRDTGRSQHDRQRYVTGGIYHMTQQGFMTVPKSSRHAHGQRIAACNTVGGA